MLRGQDLSIPWGDSRTVNWDIDLPDDVSGEDAPANLLGKDVRWWLTRSPNRGDDPLVEYHSALDDALRIDDAENGQVSLRLSSRETTLGLVGATHKLAILEPETDHQWTVSEGSFTIVR